jgi:hypothetical protein
MLVAVVERHCNLVVLEREALAEVVLAQFQEQQLVVRVLNLLEMELHLLVAAVVEPLIPMVVLLETAALVS